MGATLVTYKAVRRLPGEAEVVSLRSSVWTRSDIGWRMRVSSGDADGGPPDKADEVTSVVASGYDRMADAYLDRFGASTVRDRKLSELIAGLGPGAAVLDLGCGAGLPVARALVDHGFTVTGVDVSTEQLGRASRNVPQARFIKADMTTLDLPAGSFDAVSAFYAMSHVPRERQGALLARIAGWLKPGGLFLASFGSEVGEWSGAWLGVPMRFSHHAPEVTRQLAAQAGLTVEVAEVLRQDNEKTSFL